MKCTIWKKNGNRWSGVLCRNGGDLKSIGRLLIEKWSDPKALDKLIELGFLSSVGGTLEESVSYSRDRGELKRIFINYTLDQAKQARAAYSPTFAYTWINGRWHLGLEESSPLLKTCLEWKV